MSATVDVIRFGALENLAIPDLVAVGLPVVVGRDGPSLPAGLPADVGGIPVLAELDGAWCSQQGFTAKTGQTLVLRTAGGASTVLVGLGKLDGLDGERWRRAAAATVRAAGDGGAAALVVPSGLLGAPGPGVPVLPATDVGAAVAEGALLATYRYDEFKSAPRPGSIGRLVVTVADAVAPEVAQGVRRGHVVADAVTFARDLINCPPSDLPPRVLADRVVDRLAGIPGVEVEVWDEDRIAAERLGGLLGVARGSIQAPRLVRADYEPAHPAVVGGRVPHVVLVGKGITFDSGGLSLKTPEGMTTMKTDMSGAAIVLATLSACRDLDVPIRVTAIAPVTENMPGEAAMKPGDVLTIRNGATIEVLNTDAEGRLVLADGLVLASELAPDAIVDVATLTGAAAVALGTSVAALFGNDDGFTEQVRAAGARAGEALWPLPMPDDYADHIDSDVADMKNVGKAGQAGAIAAALLLARFVDGPRWAHLDIAGTGRSAESSGYLSKGGTAFGVRTLLTLLATFTG